MATRAGQDNDLLSTSVGQGVGTKGRFVVWTGKFIALDQQTARYLLTAWDSGIPGRVYWLDTEDSDANRPAAVGSFGARVILAQW